VPGYFADGDFVAVSDAGAVLAGGGVTVDDDLAGAAELVPLAGVVPFVAAPFLVPWSPASNGFAPPAGGSAGTTPDPEVATGVNLPLLSLDIAAPVMPAKATQTTATPIVIRVKTSPARVPKALCPPVAPNAPANPPPRPRCRSTMKIKKMLAIANRIEKISVQI
jgi:hypothetical protein